MAVFETWTSYDLQQPLKPRILDGAIFTNDNDANLFGVILTDGGQPATLAGTVSGNVIKSDGVTTAIEGAFSGNRAWVILPQAAYAVQGPVTVVIKLTSEETVTTIGAFVTNVIRSQTGTIEDPGTIIPSINTLIADIEAALSTIPPDLTDLRAAIAPDFSTGTAYSAGQYAWYSGTLYRFTAAHAAGSWTGTDVVAAGVGTDLNAARNTLDNAARDGLGALVGGRVNPFHPGYYQTLAAGSAVSWANSAGFVCTRFPVSQGDKIIINATGYTGNYRLYVLIDSSGKSVSRSNANLDGERIITIPSGVAEIAVNNRLSQQPNGYYCISGNWERNLFDISGIEQGTYQAENGKPGYTEDYCRTPLFKIEDIAEYITPGGVAGFVYKYDADGEFITRQSDTDAHDYTTGRLISNYGGDIEVTVDGQTVTKRVAYIAFALKLASPTTPEDMIAAGFSVRGVKPALIEDRVDALEYARDNTLALKSQVNFRLADFEQGGLSTSGANGNSYVYCRTVGYTSFGAIGRMVIPAGMLLIACTYYADKSFIERKSYSGGADGLTVEAAQLAKDMGHSGEAAYLRMAVKRTEDGSDVESLPSDIVASGLDIQVVGVSEDIYQQLIEIKGKLGDEGNDEIPAYYADYIAAKINTINALQDDLDDEFDSMIFITDYHYTKNAQHSPALIRKIVMETGITKLFFGGDAGASAPLSSMYRAARNNGKIYQKLWDSAPQFYGMLGNHEWNDTQNATHEGAQQAEVYTRAGVVSFYINREGPIVQGMSTEGNYYVDNERVKIRYFVLQATGQAKVTNETVAWLAGKLLATPSGWAVMVLLHYAYTGAPNSTMSPSSIIGRDNLSVIRVTQILGAVKNQTSVSVAQYPTPDNTGSSTGSVTYDFTNTNLTPICILSGHSHWDAALSVSESDYGILTIATTTDAFGYAKDKETNTSAPRQVGTTEEQAFDVVQVDLTARKVYMTRIGGGSDREFSF